MENELSKDLKDLNWDDVPFTNNYEPLIHLKISKMILEKFYFKENITNKSQNNLGG